MHPCCNSCRPSFIATFSCTIVGTGRKPGEPCDQFEEWKQKEYERMQEPGEWGWGWRSGEWQWGLRGMRVEWRVRRIRRLKEVVRVKRREEEEHRGWWHFHESIHMHFCTTVQSHTARLHIPPQGEESLGTCLFCFGSLNLSSHKVKGMLMHTTVVECNPTFWIHRKLKIDQCSDTAVHPKPKQKITIHTSHTHTHQWCYLWLFLRKQLNRPRPFKEWELQHLEYSKVYGNEFSKAHIPLPKTLLSESPVLD